MKLIKKLKGFIKKVYYRYSLTYKSVKAAQVRVDSMRDMVQKELRLLDNKYQMLFFYTIQRTGETIIDTKKRFFLDMPAATGKLRERQEKNAQLLKDFKNLCSENNLTFWLEGGTLLGAARHRGFVPWDDDIDVNMWEEDLEKLAVILKDNEKFYFRNKYNYFLRCIIPGVVLREDENVWIDVFPMTTTKFLDTGFKSTKEYVNSRCAKLRRKLHSKLRDSGKGIEFLDMDNADDSQVQIVKDVMKEFVDQIPKSNDDDCCYRSLTALNSPGGADLFYISDMFPLDQLEFEGETYPVPKDYEKWLNTYYGDMYRLPLNIQPKHFE
jgi:lipopolysaccharide cholinephosphotransferase